MSVFKNRNTCQGVNIDSLEEWIYKDVKIEGGEEGEEAKFNS